MQGRTENHTLPVMNGIAGSNGRSGRFRAVFFLALAALFFFSTAPQVQAQADAATLAAVRTDTPQETLSALFSLRSALENSITAYMQTSDKEHAVAVELISAQMFSLIDLSAVPASSQRAVGTETLAYLLDIIGRIPAPTLAEPAEAPESGKAHASYRIPGTPLKIVLITKGPDSGQYLFSARTIRDAPAFYRTVSHRPLNPGLAIKSWHQTMRQLAGPLIPPDLIAALPDQLKHSVLGTPIWKVVLVLAACLVIGIALRQLDRLTASALENTWPNLLTPAALLGSVLFLKQVIVFQINPTGWFAGPTDVAATVLGHLAMAWLVWTTIRVLLETKLDSRRETEHVLDANLLRLLSLVSAVVAVVLVLAHGLQDLGLPIASILTGLGIGGLAIALAIRPTLENLIGGFILFLDKPIRVGDWCSFGTTIGVVEQIGVRSTQIRALDRTLVTIPNAQFADMQIANRTRRDQMLIEQTIGLRYETTTAQLFYVLAQMRETCHAHPGIDSESVRIRFAGYGDFALLIEVYIFARTNNVEEFHAIREDVLIRFQAVVDESGSGFAFPSKTIYFAKDSELDPSRAAEVGDEVDKWRQSVSFPFPRFSKDELERFEQHGDYPQKGSPDFKARPEPRMAREEPGHKPRGIDD